MGVGTSDLDMMYRRIWVRADSRFAYYALRSTKTPVFLVIYDSEIRRSSKTPRYNRFLVIYDLVIIYICCVYLDTTPNFSTKFARYIRLLVITGLVIYGFYCTVKEVATSTAVQKEPQISFSLKLSLCDVVFGRARSRTYVRATASP